MGLIVRLLSSSYGVNLICGEYTELDDVSMSRIFKRSLLCRPQRPPVDLGSIMKPENIVLGSSCQKKLLVLVAFLMFFYTLFIIG